MKLLVAARVGEAAEIPISQSEMSTWQTCLALI